MDAGGYGFFLGIAPGVSYGLWNLMRVQQTVKRAELIARESGEFFDINSSSSIRFNYMFRPSQFIRPDDGDGTRRAKSLLLSIRKQAIRRHLTSAALAFLGGVIGVLIALGVTTGS